MYVCIYIYVYDMYMICICYDIYKYIHMYVVELNVALYFTCRFSINLNPHDWVDHIIFQGVFKNRDPFHQLIHHHFPPVNGNRCQQYFMNIPTRNPHYDCCQNFPIVARVEHHFPRFSPFFWGGMSHV